MVGAMNKPMASPSLQRDFAEKSSSFATAASKVAQYISRPSIGPPVVCTENLDANDGGVGIQRHDGASAFWRTRNGQAIARELCTLSPSDQISAVVRRDGRVNHAKNGKPVSHYRNRDGRATAPCKKVRCLT